MANVSWAAGSEGSRHADEHVSLAPYLDILGGIHKHGVCAMPCSVPLAEAGQYDIPPLQDIQHRAL